MFWPGAMWYLFNGFNDHLVCVLCNPVFVVLLMCTILWFMFVIHVYIHAEMHIHIIFDIHIHGSFVHKHMFVSFYFNTTSGSTCWHVGKISVWEYALYLGNADWKVWLQQTQTPLCMLVYNEWRVVKGLLCPKLKNPSSTVFEFCLID